MATFTRRLALLAGIILVAGGCNLTYLPFYLFGPEPKYPPEYHPLADKDKKKEVKVVILTYTGLETNPELLHADRELATYLAQHLSKLCQANEEKVTIINQRKVEEYKNNNPDWQQHVGDLDVIGKKFGADWVIYLELGKMSLYKPGSADQLYRGQASLTVSLVNVNNPDDVSLPPREITFSYPSESGGGFRLRDIDTPPHAFRREFLDALARRLSWQFTSHPTRDHFRCE